MAISYTIPGVKLLNQLNEPSNPRFDCVFTSNAVLANAYLGTHYTGSQLKAMDSDYGPAYTGGASEAKLADTMARLGITVTRVSSATQAGLIAILHSEVAKGHGVIVTIPSQWNSAPTVKGYNPRTYSGSSHVVLMCGYGPGMLRAANPWGGVWQDATDAWWQQRLLSGAVWVGVKSPIAKASTAMVPTDWKDAANGDVNNFEAVLTAPNGVPVIHGFRKWILTHTWDAANTPLAPEQHINGASLEPGNASIGPGARQDFRYGSLGWTQARDTYVIAVGQDVVALSQSLTDAQAQIAALQASLAAAQQAAQNAKPDPLATEALDIMTRWASLQKAL